MYLETYDVFANAIVTSVCISFSLDKINIEIKRFNSVIIINPSQNILHQGTFEIQIKSKNNY